MYTYREANELLTKKLQEAEGKLKEYDPDVVTQMKQEIEEKDTEISKLNDHVFNLKQELEE